MELKMPARDAFVRIQFDANRINARGALQAMNQLEKWAEAEVIELFPSEVAQTEARSGGNATRASKALGYIYSITLATSPEEQEDLRAIETILSNGATPDMNTLRDAEIVFNAAKYGAILVTADRGILDKAAGLEQRGTRIMTDEEAVAHVRQKLHERDEIARLVAQETGQPLPHWVGAD